MSPICQTREAFFKALLQEPCTEAALWRKSCKTGVSLKLWSKTVLAPFVASGLVMLREEDGQQLVCLTPDGVAYAQKRYGLEPEAYAKGYAVPTGNRLSVMSGRYVPPPMAMAR